MVGHHVPLRRPARGTLPQYVVTAGRDGARSTQTKDKGVSARTRDVGSINSRLSAASAATPDDLSAGAGPDDGPRLEGAGRRRWRGAVPGKRADRARGCGALVPIA